MADYLKKGFLLGLGAAISGKEKLEKKVSELVEKNELTQEQARQVLSDFIEKGETKTEEWSDKQTEQTKKLAHDLGLVTRDEFEALEKRIVALEANDETQEEQGE